MANLFDASEAATTEPTEIRAGTFVQWKRADLADTYDPTLYELKYVFRDREGGSHTFSVTATDSGGDFLIQIPTATSADYKDGEYNWDAEIRRLSDSEIVVVESGRLTVTVDIDVNASDNRSKAEKMLEQVEDLLQGKFVNDVASYSIAGRSLTKMSIDQLLDARNQLRAEVAKEKRQEDIKNGRGNRSKIKVRFL